MCSRRASVARATLAMLSVSGHQPHYQREACQGCSVLVELSEARGALAAVASEVRALVAATGEPTMRKGKDGRETAPARFPRTSLKPTAEGRADPKVAGNDGRSDDETSMLSEFSPQRGKPHRAGTKAPATAVYLIF